MKKITLLLSLILFAGSVFPQLAIEKLWEFSTGQSTKPPWMATDDCRSMVMKDGKLYIMVRTASAIKIIDPNAANIATEVATPTNLALSGYLPGSNCLAVTEDGQLLGGSYAGATLKISKINTSTGVTTQLLEKLPATGIGRFDYFSTFGDFSATGNGYIIASTCPSAGAGGFNTYKWDVANGAVSPDVFSVIARPTAFGSSSMLIPVDNEYYYAMSANTNPELFKMDGTITQFKSGVLPAQGAAAATGMATFELEGNKYFIRTDGRFGGMTFYDINSGIANAKKLTITSAVLGATANATVKTTIVTEKISDTELRVFLLAPNNGIAAYKITVLPKKTFTVTVPNGTEKVYIAGSFTEKNWDANSDPYELMPTANPNEFTGTFPCSDDIQYKYLCGKDWDYQEGEFDGANDPKQSSNRTYKVTDEVPVWYRVNKVTFMVAPKAQVTNLFVKGSWDGWTTPIEMTPYGGGAMTKGLKAPNPTGIIYTATIGGNPGDKLPANTQYKYYTNVLSPENWEVNEDGTHRENRWSIAPVMNDYIPRFDNTTGIENAIRSASIMCTNTGVQIETEAQATIEIFTTNGVLIEKTISNGSYSRILKNGVYIIRIDGQATKFIK
jgi:signal peptidase I